MTQVILKPKTRKGKNVITNHGEVWIVINQQLDVPFSTDKDWLLLQSEKTEELRWVRNHHHSDKDFFMTVDLIDKEG